MKGKVIMKMNNFTMINSMNVLNGYANKKLPQKISFAITKNLISIGKEYKIYEEQLKKIIDSYSQYFEKDENGNIKMDNNGLPEISDEVQNANLYDEVNELLSIEIDLDLHPIDEKVFDYEDSDRYSPLSPVEIMQLQNILCIKE
jgi:hypothetical protein